MFTQATKDSINGWGQVFRFVTPILITIAIFILSGIKDTIKEIKETTAANFAKIEIKFDNHLEHHRKSEVLLGERLSAIETRIRGWK